MTDKKPNDDESVVPTPTDLDAVHEKAIYEIENEEPVKDEPIVPEEVVEPVKEEPEKEEPVTVPDTPEPEARPVAVPAIEEEVQKVSIKDSDGKVQEFATAEDIPDDFEPFSYKEFAVGMNKLSELNIDNKAKAKSKAEAAEAEERTKRIDKIKEAWQADQDALVKQGLIDADEEKSKPIVDGVFAVMQEEMDTGTTLGFKQAYEIYSYRESLKTKDTEVKAKNDEKKRRGAFVQPGGSTTPSAPGRQGKVFEAPPTGISLDQVHENILGSL